MSSIFNILYNISSDALSLIYDIGYTIYDVSIFGIIFIALPLKSVDDKLILHKDIVSSCNSFCTDVTYDIGWKYCEVVTIISTCYKKTIVPEFHRITNYKFRNEIIVVKDGIETHYFKNWEELYNYNVDLTYDFILYTDYQTNDIKKNYTAIIDDKQLKSNYIVEKKSAVNFIIFQLTMNNIKYDISLKEPKYFILKNNTLKYPFFKWYMKSVYDITLTEQYSVYYMTQDMSIAVLHSPFFIKFNEDSVTSFSSGKPPVVQSETETNCENEVPTTTYETETDRECIINDNMVVDDRSDISNDSITDEILSSIRNSEKLKTH